jgi:putative membrane protein
VFIKKIIVLYVLIRWPGVQPWLLCHTGGGVYFFYVLGILELIAEEIADPFGKHANDLPMQRRCESIRRNVEEILN